ncbi:ABC transporter permease [Oerskovia sp. Root918]|uniref:ABC transporter permease n=1 Tax=Oerskovia sp. Root918 TaxID=1736607 RepID=UPI001910EEC7|nr:ABC transporter permease [Oerskovia sp. Root918]
MRGWNVFVAELQKMLALPGVWTGAAVAVLGTAALTLLNAVGVRDALVAGRPEDTGYGSAFDTAFAAMPIGTVGAVVIGVIAVSSEYTANSPDAGGGRQIGTTLVAVPRRASVLVAKVTAVVLLVIATAVVAVPASVALAEVIIADAATATVPLDEAVRRCLGAALYWTLTALLALAVTVFTRSGVVPLLVLVVNSSLVSVSLLLTMLTPLAHWLPDMAGRRLFGDVDTVAGGLSPGPGALVMAAWALALLAVAGTVFSRRDA